MLAAVVLAAAMCLAASGCAEVNVNLGDPNGQAPGKPAHTYQYKWP